MGMLSEFKEFAMRGNVIDLAVGVVIGAAFGRIVTALVEKVIMPPIGLLLGGVDFSKWVWVLKDASVDAAGNAVPAVGIGIGECDARMTARVEAPPVGDLKRQIGAVDLRRNPGRRDGGVGGFVGGRRDRAHRRMIAPAMLFGACVAGGRQPRRGRQSALEPVVPQYRDIDRVARHLRRIGNQPPRDSQRQRRG